MCFVLLVGLGYLIYLMCIVGCGYCCCLDLGWLVFAALWFVGWLLVVAWFALLRVLRLG